MHESSLPKSRRDPRCKKRSSSNQNAMREFCFRRHSRRFCDAMGSLGGVPLACSSGSTRVDRKSKCRCRVAQIGRTYRRNCAKAQLIHQICAVHLRITTSSRSQQQFFLRNSRDELREILPIIKNSAHTGTILRRWMRCTAINVTRAWMSELQPNNGSTHFSTLHFNHCDSEENGVRAGKALVIELVLRDFPLNHRFVSHS